MTRRGWKPEPVHVNLEESGTLASWELRPLPPKTRAAEDSSGESDDENEDDEFSDWGDSEVASSEESAGFDTDAKALVLDLHARRGTLWRHRRHQHQGDADEEEDENEDDIRHAMAAMVHGRKFGVCLGFAILLNTVVIGVEVDYGCVRAPNQYDPCDSSQQMIWSLVENGFIVFFAMEMLMRFAAEGFLGYFRDPWNRLDFVLVWAAILDSWILPTVLKVLEDGAGEKGQNDQQEEEEEEANLRILSVLRILRVFRILRILRLAKLAKMLTVGGGKGALELYRQIQVLTQGLREGGKSVFWVLLLLLLYLYVFGMLLAILIGQAPPAGPEGFPNGYDFRRPAGPAGAELSLWNATDYFGNVPRSMFTLLQVATRDQWNTGLTRPVVRREPLFLFCFLGFFVVANYALLNTVVATLVQMVSELQAQQKARHSKAVVEKEAHILENLRRVLEQADVDKSGDVDYEEFRNIVRKRFVKDKFAAIDIHCHDFLEVFRLLDADGLGAIKADAFVQGCKRLRGQARAFDLYRVGRRILVYNGHVDGMLDRLRGQNNLMEDLTDRLATISDTRLERDPKTDVKTARAESAVRRRANAIERPLEARLDRAMKEQAGKDSRATLSGQSWRPSSKASRFSYSSSSRSVPEARAAPRRFFPLHFIRPETLAKSAQHPAGRPASRAYGALWSPPIAGSFSPHDRKTSRTPTAAEPPVIAPPPPPPPLQTAVVAASAAAASAGTDGHTAIQQSWRPVGGGRQSPRRTSPKQRAAAPAKKAESRAAAQTTEPKSPSLSSVSSCSFSSLRGERALSSPREKTGGGAAATEKGDVGAARKAGGRAPGVSQLDISNLPLADRLADAFVSEMQLLSPVGSDSFGSVSLPGDLMMSPFTPQGTLDLKLSSGGPSSLGHLPQSPRVGRRLGFGDVPSALSLRDATSALSLPSVAKETDPRWSPR